MNKILKKVMVGTAMALTLSGVAGMMPAATASASNYYGQDSRIIMHNRYKQNGYCIAELEIDKSTFENRTYLGLECGEGIYTTYYNFDSNGEGSYGQWGTTSAEYNSDTGKYLVTFKIEEDRLYGPVRIYCELNNGDTISDDNNGYDYQF